MAIVRWNPARDLMQMREEDVATITSGTCLRTPQNGAGTDTCRRTIWTI